MSCFCGSSSAYEQCCKPIIIGELSAQSPEELMRSRYSAYATKNGSYIYNTYAIKSREANSTVDIQEWAEQTTWLKLNVLKSSAFNNTSISDLTHKTLPTVEFFAFYIHNKTFYQMHEISRFTQENELWVYVDGDIITHEAITPPKRNEACFCQSNKKFKQCCAKKN